MKNMFKKNKSKFPTAAGPRPLDEITKDYSVVSSQAFDAQYKAYVYSRELEQLNARLVEINQEAAMRKELDRQAEEATKEETTNV